MADISAFRGLRPKKDLAKDVSELPYDVVSRSEAKKIAENNEYSFFHITRPEISMSDDTDPYHESVYQKGKENLHRFIRDKILIKDETPKLYLYTQIMNEREQTGLVACVNIDDYINNNVKKHELTREDKERDRTRHLDILNANTGLVFLLYREDGSKKGLFERAKAEEPEYDFETDDGIRHIVRVINDEDLIKSFEESFAENTLFIADGHHRAASAVNVGLMRRKREKNFTGKEEYNRFLAVIFPHDQLKILPYNRVVRDLCGLNTEDFISKISGRFVVNRNGVKVPGSKRSFSMYIEGRWYSLVYTGSMEGDTVDKLDVRILQKNILEPLLGIKDPRTDKRINFIGGIRGVDELEKLVDSGQYRVAFSLYPTSVEELMAVASEEGIMPPKSTWFEPKLRSGLFIHLLS